MKSLKYAPTMMTGIGAIGALVLAMQATPALAVTATASLGITATVQATCALTGGTLAFGTYSAAQLDASTTISVQCTNTTPWVVTLDPGLAPSATDTTRKMAGPSGAVLGYQLYKDTSRSAHWGADNTDGDASSGTGNGNAQSLTDNGRDPAAQYDTPGTYSDTITATVTY